ncbi:MAG: monooxygenase [Gammaproteobacteria bacterium]|nr:monooxygenase [Gammaproteobacteria bacterium]
MSIKKIWDIHLSYEGEVTENFMAETKKLAESIAQEAGIIWKIWTYEAGSSHFGSTYLFRDLEALETYKAMHVKRLNNLGITVTSDHIFDIMEDLSQINNAPLDD